MDQFEELFTRFDRQEQGRFVASLDSLLSNAHALTVIIVARDDYFSEISRLETLTLRAGRSGIVTVLRTLRRSEVEAVIVEPVKSVGAQIEPSLVTALTMDAMRLASLDTHDDALEPRVDATVLPLLESTLSQLWASRKDNVMMRNTYRDGGITDSISSWASDVYKGLGPEYQEIARSIFLNLVDIDVDRTVQSTIRRSIAKLELYRLDRANEDIDLVLNAFVAQRLIVASRSEGLERVEIIHDVLIRQWVLLRAWIDREKQFLLWRHEAQSNWQAWKNTSVVVAERDDGRLLRGRALEESEKWLQYGPSMVSSELTQYVDVALKRRKTENALREAERVEKEQQQKDRERLRAWILRLAVAASFVLLAVAAFALKESQQAKSDQALVQNNAAALASFVQSHLAAEGTSVKRSRFTEDDANTLDKLAGNLFAAIPLSGINQNVAVSRLKSSDTLFTLDFSRSGSCSSSASKMAPDDCTHLFEKALETAKRELSDSEQYAAKDPNGEEWLHYESQAEQHIGDILERQAKTLADLETARLHYESSIKYTQQLVDKYPERFEFLQEEAAARADRGDALRAEYNLEGALRDYKWLTSRIDVNWQRKVAITYGKIGDLLAEERRFKEAEVAYRQNFATSKQLVTVEPSDDFKRGVGIGYEKLGFIMRKENLLPIALRDYFEEIKIFTKLNSNRRDGVFKRDEALGYLGLGDVWGRLGNPRASMLAYKQYATRIESMARDEPSDQRVRHDLAIGYERLGEALRVLGEPHVASAMFRQCLSVADPNVTFDSRNPEPRDVRSVCQSGLAKLALL